MEKLKVKKMENRYQANSNQRKTGLDVLLSDKIDYKAVTGHKIRSLCDGQSFSSGEIYKIISLCMHLRT